MEKETSRRFQVINGVRQGGALACLHFNIALEKVIRDARIVRHSRVLIHSTQILVFADKDVVSRTLHNLKENFIKLEEAAEAIRLKINEAKTKLMLVRYMLNPN
jgi:hypothetical protein